MRSIELPRYCWTATAVILSFMLSCSVSDDLGGSGGGDGNQDSFFSVFKGTATYLDANYSDVFMYGHRVEEDLFYIEGFFGAEGGLLFTWDKDSNLLSVEESYTGLFNERGPIYVVSQSKYRFILGSEAQNSTYIPSTGLFTFHVIFEFADYDGTTVYMPSILTYTVQEVIGS